MSYEPKNHSGAAVGTTLAGAGLDAAALGFTIADATGWPSANFVVTLSRGSSAEEKVLVASRVGTSCVIDSGGRGYDGTTAQSHPSGDSAFHTMSAVEADEANQVAAQVLGQVTAKGDLLLGPARTHSVASVWALRGCR